MRRNIVDYLDFKFNLWRHQNSTIGRILQELVKFKTFGHYCYTRYGFVVARV